MPNNRRMRLRYFQKDFSSRNYGNEISTKRLIFFPLWALRILVKKGHEFTDIGVCVTMLRLRGWGVTTIIFSLRRNIFSLGPFFTYISTPCQWKGSVIFFFPSSSKWSKMFYSFERTQHVFFLSNYFLTSKQKKN